MFKLEKLSPNDTTCVSFMHWKFRNCFNDVKLIPHQLYVVLGNFGKSDFDLKLINRTALLLCNNLLSPENIVHFCTAPPVVPYDQPAKCEVDQNDGSWDIPESFRKTLNSFTNANSSSVLLSCSVRPSAVQTGRLEFFRSGIQCQRSWFVLNTTSHELTLPLRRRPR